MGTWSYVKGVFVATWSGLRHLTHPRMTLRYPEQKLDLEEQGYQFDAKKGVGLPGFKGRHILFLDKCTGCQLCAIACDGIAVAIEMQHVQKGKPQNKKDIWPAVDYGRCVAPWTSIVTSTGIKRIRDVHIGDKVLTHTGKFRTVTQVFRRKYTGRLYRIRTLGNVEELTVTEDHPILVHKDAATTWLYPNEIKYRTYLTRPVVKDTVPVELVTYSYELYHSSGKGGYFTTETVSLPCSPGLMRLIGYYLTEGSSDGYRASFDINKKEHLIQNQIVSAVAEVFGADVSSKPDPDSKGLKLVIDSVRVASFFHQFGQYANTKEMPGWMLSIPIKLQRELIRAIFLGDGHYCDKRYRYKTAIRSKNYFTIRTTSHNLATQAMLILGRLGIIASVSPNRQKDRKLCYSVTVHAPFVEKMARICGFNAKNKAVSHGHIHLRKGMIVSPVVKVSRKEVRDFEVFNLEVGEDHSYVAGNQSVHNCVFCGLCVDACPFDALFMTNDYELSAYDKASLKYTPDMLAVPPKLEGKTYKVKIDTERGTTSHG